MASEDASTYTLYRRGIELLEDGSFEAAAEPLAEAAQRAPEKSSVREALGRAYFRTRRFAKAAEASAPAITWRSPATCDPIAATTASSASA